MAEFKMQKVAGKLPADPDTLFPRMLLYGVVDTDTIAEEISRKSAFSRGDVKGLLTVLAEELAGQMARGYSVKLEGLGSFRPLLRMREGAEPELAGDEQRRNRSGVEIGKVSFTADKELLRECNERTDLRRVRPREGEYSTVALAPEQRRLLLVRHLESERSITIPEYSRMTGLSRSSAGRELRRFAHGVEAFLTTSGRGPSLRYQLLE